ncbi:MAG TPA: cobyrinate a,c-diamide synthase [Pirellulales bacterium]|jgi:cobyrinic acid a,c-diamide synthase|nr:cobyrinate a,c-diamide synthase [Pirellulales bacterium]
MTSRLVLAGSQSGVGKTTITAGLIAALVRRGLRIQPFKVGPDYIDPTYHGLAAGRPCHNLDAWMIPPSRIAPLFSRRAAGCDLALIEGVMGLFDGCGYEDETGSTAQVAKLLKAPVVLVIDAGRLARSAAAVANGFATFDLELPLAGFIVNRVGSERHGRGVAQAIERATGKPVFGTLPRDAHLNLAERHLGLVPTVEPGAWREFLDAAADAVSRHLDLNRLLAVATAAPALIEQQPANPVLSRAPVGQRPVIAVARDEAFHFTYEENLELLSAAGAELVFFSPLRDRQLPANAAGVLLSGGFPEIYAAQLAANVAMHHALRQAHADGLPIYAECGGLMALTESLVDADGRHHAMVGLLPGQAVMGDKLTLGYRHATAAQDGCVLNSGDSLRGHEFHYSTWVGRPDALPPAYFVTGADRQGSPRAEGAGVGNLWASFVHVHFWSKPEIAERLVEACRAVDARRRAALSDAEPTAAMSLSPAVADR